MWWLVTISPSGETNEPDPPLLKRTDAFWARASQSGVRSKPYLALRWSRGGSLTSHMPSSAGAVMGSSPRVTRAVQVRRVTAGLRGRDEGAGLFSGRRRPRQATSLLPPPLWGRVGVGGNNGQALP